jgi:hypothetical protein
LRVGVVVAAVAGAVSALPSAPLPVCDYDVGVGEGGRELRIEARLPTRGGEDLAVGPGLGAFLRDVETEEDGAWRALPGGEVFRSRACAPGACHVRYRFLLAEAARAESNADSALEFRGVFVSPPSSWLLLPSGEGARLRCRFRVRTPGGVGFVTGVFPSAGSVDTYELGGEDMESPPSAAFGPLQTDLIEVPGGTVQVAVSPGELSVQRAALLGWVGGAARTVASFYGRLPVPRVLVLVLAGGWGGIGNGVTMGNGGASIRLRVGRGVGERDLDRDWMLTHEMVHLALPNLDYTHRWLEEGIATYVEPIARARMGALAAEEVWKGFVQGMPQGLPAEGDRGLDRTHTWGRTYWGGALFCLLADVAIRERTQGERSLDDALKAVLAAGGNISTRWSLGQTLDAADRAVGVPVLRELYAGMGPRPASPDLDRLWKRLGLRVQAGRVDFDEDAPLAALRRAITRGPTPRP